MPLLLGLFVKKEFPTPVQVKIITKNKIGDIQQIYLYQNVCESIFSSVDQFSFAFSLNAILFYINYNFLHMILHPLSQPVHCLSAEIRPLFGQNHTFTIKTSYLDKSRISHASLFACLLWVVPWLPHGNDKCRKQQSWWVVSRTTNVANSMRRV